MALKNKHIIIIHSGSTNNLADADTLMQVEEIRAALQENGFMVSVENVNESSFIKKITQYDKTKVIVFNLVESFAGSDANMYQFTALLDFLQLPYTGATTEFLLLTKDKVLSKQILKANNINTPEWLESSQISNAQLTKKYIVKSISEHASIGIDDGSISDINLAHIIAEKKQQYGGEWFAEEYIEGREFNISVMMVNGKIEVLPIPEMVFAEDFVGKYNIVDYSAKWEVGTENHHRLQRIFLVQQEPELQKKLHAIIKQVCDVFKINSYARIDFRVDENNVPWVIDINSNPCLSLDAGLMAAVDKFGMSEGEAINNILKAV
jgi:D-alanine-D-alanine ligase